MFFKSWVWQKIQVLGAVQVLESQVFPPSPQLAHEYATLFQNYPSYALSTLECILSDFTLSALN